MVQDKHYVLHEEHAPGDWAYCNLCRSAKQAKRAYSKAKKRQVQWPAPPQYDKAPVKDYHGSMSVSEVFHSMMQYIGSTSRQCGRYYSSRGRSSTDKVDTAHAQRFHSGSKPKKLTKNPLNASEDIQISLDPGVYAVSAGKWGQQQELTHMIKLGQGQVIDLDFVM